MYFVLYMKKVQTGLVIEVYSISCLVKFCDINLKCIAIKGVVVGDMVEIEVIQDSNEIKGKITIIAVINDNFSAASVVLKLSFIITLAIDIQAAAPNP